MQCKNVTIAVNARGACKLDAKLKFHLEVIVAAVFADDHALVHLGARSKKQDAAVLQRLKRIRHAARTRVRLRSAASAHGQRARMQPAATHVVPVALDIKLPFLRVSIAPLNLSYPLNRRVSTPVPRVEFLNSLW